MVSEKDLDIIACMAFDASMSVADVSRATGLKEHVVRHSLKKLVDGGAIVLRPYVNPYALGLMEFYAEIALETPGQAALSALTKAFVDAPTSTFVSELTGDNHLSVMFLAQSLLDVPRFLDEICRKVPEVKFRKLVSPVFEVKVCHPNRQDKGAPNNAVSYSAGSERQKFDELDEKILISLGTGRIASRRELSKRCGVPETTVDYRIQTLQQRGILLAMGYRAEVPTDTLAHYSLRESASRPCAELKARIDEVAMKHPSVRSVMTLLGLVDYVIDVRLTQAALISAFSQELHRYLEPYISKIEVVPVLMNHKVYVHPDELDIIQQLRTAQ